jgi:Protein of unknown function (DUF3592)
LIFNLPHSSNTNAIVHLLSFPVWAFLQAVPVWSLLGLVIGLALFNAGWRATLKSRRYDNWKPTDAEITGSHLTRSEEKDKYGCRSYDPNITFTYEVGGVKHTATTIAPPDDTSLANKGAIIVQRYPVGAKVVAYHDPEAPSNAYLEIEKVKGKMGHTILGIAMIIVFGSLACFQVVQGFKSTEGLTAGAAPEKTANH